MWPSTRSHSSKERTRFAQVSALPRRTVPVVADTWGKLDAAAVGDLRLLA